MEDESCEDFPYWLFSGNHNDQVHQPSYVGSHNVYQISDQEKYIANNMNVDPLFFPLEFGFSQLSLSPSVHTASTSTLSSQYASNNINGCSSINQRGLDLQRTRLIDSAARGYSQCRINNTTPYGILSGATNNYSNRWASNNHPFEMYRLRQNMLDDSRGKNTSLLMKVQQNYRILQKALEGGKSEDVYRIFTEVKYHVRELMVDQSGNYLIQKLFEVCDERQITELLLVITSDRHHFLRICTDQHGTRTMQKLLHHLSTAEQRSIVSSALRHTNTVALIKDLNAHHVIQHCLKYFFSEDNKHILDVAIKSCLDIATDQSGCCVIQQCVLNADGDMRERLLSAIAKNSLTLSEHRYGNYVVQHILGLRIPHATKAILMQLAGHYVTLSMNKYGSNVVERCLKESQENQAMQIIQEIINSPNFLLVLQDPYGNYVAQSALAIAKGWVLHVMIDRIHLHYAYLHSHPHGKRVLERTRGSKFRI